MQTSMQNQRKLIEAGFTLFRLELTEKKIKRLNSPGAWRTYKKFDTQVSCLTTWEFLTMNDKYLEG